MEGRVESGFELGITCSDTMRNYRLSQKLKLLGYGEFNHLTNILSFKIKLGPLDFNMVLEPPLECWTDLPPIMVHVFGWSATRDGAY
jgi:hypothetical protein